MQCSFYGRGEYKVAKITQVVLLCKEYVLFVLTHSHLIMLSVHYRLNPVHDLIDIICQSSHGLSYYDTL